MGSGALMVEAHIREAGYRDRTVLKEIEVELKAGETLLVLGPSGSGKTTLILALTGVLSNLLEGYVDGRVRVAGIDPLTPQGFREVPRILGVVLQDPDKQISMPTPYDEVLFTLENLGYPEEEADRRTREALRWAGLGNKMMQEVESLSGGEKKRLCIAASIVHNPRLLIFDEPTANLDPPGVRMIISYIDRLRREGYTLIVIEHKAGFFLNRADRIIVLHRGREVEGLKGAPTHRLLSRLEELGVDTGARRIRIRSRLSGEEPVVVVRKASYRYKGAEKPALRDVSLKVPRGSVFTLVGNNGSGKTTLLRLIAGFYKPLSGEVYVEGREPWRLGRKERPRMVFIVPQEPDYLFSKPTVRDEVRMAAGRSKTPEEAAGELRELLDSSPYKLSHGQRRWLAYTIARLYEPRIMMLDEPTAGLDLNLLRSLVRWIEEHRRKTTFIVATHDARLVAEAATHAAILENGRIVGEGVDKALEYLGEGT